MEPEFSLCFRGLWFRNPKTTTLWDVSQTNPVNHGIKTSHYHQQIPQLVSVTGFKKKQPSSSMELGFPLGFLWGKPRILSTCKTRKLQPGVESPKALATWEAPNGSTSQAPAWGFKRTLTRWWFPKMVGFPNKPMGCPI